MAVDAVIEVTARQWQWQFRYLDGNGRAWPRRPMNW